MKKRLLISGFTMLCTFLLNFSVYAKEYKDVRPAVKKAVDEFDNQKVLDKFINKYGSGYFRPTATVTREDLLLALHEYNKLNQTLLEYQKVLVKKISSLKTQLNKIVITGKNTAKQKKTQQKTEQNVSAIQIAEINEELSIIKDKLSLLDKPHSTIPTINENKISKIIQKSSTFKKIINKEIKRSMAKQKPINQYSEPSFQSNSKKAVNTMDKDDKTLTKISIGLSLVAMLFMAR